MSQAFVVIWNSGSAGIVSKTTSQNSQMDGIVDSDFVLSLSRSRKLYFARVLCCVSWILAEEPRVAQDHIDNCCAFHNLDLVLRRGKLAGLVFR